MRRSSTSDNGNVKVTAKQREKLLDVLRPNIKDIVKDGVEQYIGAGTKFMLELLMHAEARERCGDWHSRFNKRELVRWGSEKGKAIIDGVKRPVRRPRIRAKRNFAEGEVQLETYTVMNRTELLDGPLVAAIMSGVSARRYAQIVARGLEAKGIKKSAISRKAIAATKDTVEQFRKRRLDKHDLVVLLFDGIHVAKRQSIVCIGIDMSGTKHVIGLRVGSTENEIVCRDLLRDLIDRGLSIDSEYLFLHR